MMGKRINQEAMLWRFLQKGLDAVIVRDADSCFSKRETRSKNGFARGSIWARPSLAHN